MRRILPLIFLAILVGAGIFLLRSEQTRFGPAPRAPVAVAPDAPALRAAGDPVQRAEESPELTAKRARIDAQTRTADMNRRSLFQTNLDSVDVAIAKSEAEGGNPEYIEALEARRALLEDQAWAEAEALPGTREAATAESSGSSGS